MNDQLKNQTLRLTSNLEEQLQNMLYQISRQPMNIFIMPS